MTLDIYIKSSKSGEEDMFNVTLSARDFGSRMWIIYAFLFYRRLTITNYKLTVDKVEESI